MVSVERSNGQHTGAMAGARRRQPHGFTLLELLIVMTLIGILASIAIPALVQYPIRAKEAVLKTNLRSIRDNLEKYYADKGRYPASLDELVPKYLKRLPDDPLTKLNTTWVPVIEEEDDEIGPPPLDDGEGEGGPGIMDIHSSSTAIATTGEPYSTW